MLLLQKDSAKASCQIQGHHSNPAALKLLALTVGPDVLPYTNDYGCLLLSVLYDEAVLIISVKHFFPDSQQALRNQSV